jgi:hypothetical protein
MAEAEDAPRPPPRDEATIENAAAAMKAQEGFG